MSYKLISKRLKIILFFLSFLTTQFCNSQIKYCLIKGNVSNENFGDIVYLLKGNKPFINFENMEIIDSIMTNKGLFSFKVPLNYSEYYSIKLKTYKKGFVVICSPKTTIKIIADTSNFYYPQFVGSKENRLRKKYIDGLNPLISIMNNYADSALYARNDTFKYNKYVSLNIFWSNKIKNYNLMFIKKYPYCLTSLNMYNTYYKFFSEKSVKTYLNTLPIELQNNPITKEINYKKNIFEKELKKIKKFYDIKFLDTSNNVFNFNSYKDKLVLVDFWASWCKPCIENFPLLKKIEVKFKNKKFKIISVSLDENLKKWKRGIVNSELTWENISDLKAWDGLVAKFLNITSIPRYILIGRDGYIIDNDVKEEEIEKVILDNL